MLGDAIAGAGGGNGAAPAAPRRGASARAAAAAGGGDTLASPLQGNVFKVLVEQGADVEEGALICIIEAMKMENEITAHKAGKVAELPISEGAAVTVGATLAVITAARLGGEPPPVMHISTAWVLMCMRAGSISAIAELAATDYGVVDVDGRSARSARPSGRSGGRLEARTADPASSRGVRGGAPPADAAPAAGSLPSGRSAPAPC